MTAFNKVLLDEVNVNEWAVFEFASDFVRKENKAWAVLEPVLLLKAIRITDLTTLAGNDTISNVTMLVHKAICPLQPDILCKLQAAVVSLIEKIQSIDLKKFVFTSKSSETVIQIHNFRLSNEDIVELKSLVKLLGFNSKNVPADLRRFLALKNDISEFKNANVPVAAICVYPSMAKIVDNVQKEKLSYQKGSNASDENMKKENTHLLPIATVAAGFPTGQYDLDSKTKEIDFAIRSGASEIDIVISRYLVIGERWEELYNEIRVLKAASGIATLKTILAVGECGSLQNVYKASMVAMMAGSDYIKTSTGKETVNATIPVGIVMCRAIRNFYVKTGKKVGLKPAGGIKTAEDALQWLKLIMTELGVEWLPHFRIGASTLLDNIKQRLSVLIKLL